VAKAKDRLRHALEFCDDRVVPKVRSRAPMVPEGGGQGRASAQNDVGWIYQQGLGVPRDYNEALRWFRKSADQGFFRAENNLGIMYENGWGVPQDMAEAARWYKMSADQGHPKAQFNLASMYAGGRGVAKGRCAGLYPVSEGG
jgi:TPR repeat protein